MVVPHLRFGRSSRWPAVNGVWGDCHDANAPCAGSCIRVWQHPPVDSQGLIDWVPHGEWAEVVKIDTAKDGTASVLCEMLSGTLFTFAPDRVNAGVDTRVAKYEVQCDSFQRKLLHRAEARRLMRAIDAKTNKVGRMPEDDYSPRDNSDFTYAHSQIRVKVTFLSEGMPSSKRQALQATLEKGIERKAEQIYGTPHNTDVGPANSARHHPELCHLCIKKGGWCSGSLHLKDAALRLARSTEEHVGIVRHPDKPGVGSQWRSSDAGIEIEVMYRSEPVLVQLRPWLFCISHQDRFLFGKPVYLRPRGSCSSSQSTVSSAGYSTDDSPSEQ